MDTSSCVHTIVVNASQTGAHRAHTRSSQWSADVRKFRGKCEECAMSCASHCIVIVFASASSSSTLSSAYTSLHLEPSSRDTQPSITSMAMHNTKDVLMRSPALSIVLSQQHEYYACASTHHQQVHVRVVWRWASLGVRLFHVYIDCRLG